MKTVQQIKHRAPLPVFLYIESNTRLNWIQRAMRRLSIYVKRNRMERK